MTANKWTKGTKGRPARGHRPKGIPKTGGRRKGTSNKLTVGKLVLKGLKDLKGEYTSLIFFQHVYRNEDAPPELRMRAAAAALPYEHRALKAVDMTIDGTVTVHIVD